MLTVPENINNANLYIMFENGLAVGLKESDILTSIFFQRSMFQKVGGRYFLLVIYTTKSQKRVKKTAGVHFKS
jgi:hypothetical protein